MKCISGAVVLYTIFVLYLVFGGAVFFWSELLYNKQNNITNQDNVGEGTFSVGLMTDQWDIFAGMFLAMSILTTIGYGNFVPHTLFGKVFTIFYGTFGIPLTGIVLAKFSDYFGEKLLLLHESQRKRFANETIGLISATLIFILSGLSVFMLIPALIFSAVEDWQYLDSFYFTFVTLTTIGFGDLVAAQYGHEQWLWLYRLSTLIWTFLGIGYWLVVAQFITKALKSKQLRMKFIEARRGLDMKAEEIRAAVDDRLKTKQNFVLKSKVTMDFLVNFGTSLCSIELENQQACVPGICTLVSRRKGSLVALFHLPLMHFLKNTETVEKDRDETEELFGPPGCESRTTLGCFSSETSSLGSHCWKNESIRIEDGLSHDERSRHISKPLPMQMSSTSLEEVDDNCQNVDPLVMAIALHELLDKILEVNSNLREELPCGRTGN